MLKEFVFFSLLLVVSSWRHVELVNRALEYFKELERRGAIHKDSIVTLEAKETLECTANVQSQIFSQYADIRNCLLIDSKDPTTCQPLITADEFCVDQCATLWQNFFKDLVKYNCMDLLYKACATSATCDIGEACYLGFCTAACANADQCQNPCSPNPDIKCETAPGTGTLTVCQNPLVTTVQQHRARINAAINLISSGDWCVANANGEHCYDIGLNATGRTICEAVADIGCCAGFLWRIAGVCTTAADDNFLFVHNNCTEINWDARCAGEKGICPATGGGAGPFPNSASALQPVLSSAFIFLLLSALLADT